MVTKHLKTRGDLIGWITERQKQLIFLDYDLIAALGEHEIDKIVRELRFVLWKTDNTLNEIRHKLREEEREKSNEE